LVVVKGNNVTPTSRNGEIKCLCCLGFGHIAYNVQIKESWL
jgi:hypothetical protein